jgi:hypothetical protein
MSCVGQSCDNLGEFHEKDFHISRLSGGCGARLFRRRQRGSCQAGTEDFSSSLMGLREGCEGAVQLGVEPELQRAGASQIPVRKVILQTRPEKIVVGSSSMI